MSSANRNEEFFQRPTLNVQRSTSNAERPIRIVGRFLDDEADRKTPVRSRYLRNDRRRQSHDEEFRAGRFHFTRRQAALVSPARFGRCGSAWPHQSGTRQRPSWGTRRNAGLEDQARSISLSASGDRLEQRQNRSSPEDFSIRHLAHHYFFNQTNAFEKSGNFAQKGNAALDQCQGGRSCCDAENSA